MSPTCPTCRHENREGLKFCTLCGAKLGLVCPSCGAVGEPDERFCGHCGASFASPAAPGPDSAPAVPAAAEKKQITVLFADVAGSMDLQEQLDAEVWAHIMGRFVSILAEGVRKFGGTVDKFTGDGIMALFGAPVAQEDHARRACHTAWHLTGAIGAYSEELRQGQGVELQVRLGLNSGEVVVGRVGEDVTIDPTALGHTVGLAQRMEAIAEPGTAYLTDHTARLVEGWFGLGDLGPRPVKGARDPLLVYVLGPPVGAPVRRALGGSRLVGRDREVTVLEDALTMAMEGQAQVVGVVGEAGVGKSRLCDEFGQRVSARGITVRRAAGVSHGKDVPLLPILAVQRDYFGISEADNPEEARTKITERLLDLDPNLEEALPVVFDFLEVPDPDHPIPPMAPEVRMRRIFDTVRRITARRSERETLVLVFEDLHWFDPQSEAFLERLIESFPGSRTLVVANFRPEFSAGWMRHSYYRQLPVTPLRDAAVGDLLGGLLGMDLSLAPLLGFVQERTGGNPFFVEEVVRALVEDGTLAGQPGDYRLTRPLHDLKVPPNVQAVLAARIDRLPPEHKGILQTASVIGPVFDPVVLAEASGSTSEALEGALAVLCGAELLQEAGSDPAVQFRFWHPLTQEVAYGSLLSDRRRLLHAAVAEALMVKESDRLDESAAVLAWHWEQAGRPLEAARWSLRAGGWALRTDVREAIRRWSSLVDLLASADDDESLELTVRARVRLIQYGARTGMPLAEAEDLYAKARVDAERLGNRDLLALLVTMSGSAKLNAGDVRGGFDRYLEGFRLAEDSDDPGVPAAGVVGPILGLTFVGPLADGLAFVERGLDLCADDPDRGLGVLSYSPLARILQIRAGIHLRTGCLEAVRTDVERAIAIARPSGEGDTLIWALALVPHATWLEGEAADTTATAQEAVRVGEETGNVMALAVALEALAVSHLAAGRASDALVTCDRVLAAMRQQSSGLLVEASVLAIQAHAYLAVGASASAVTVAEEAVEVSRRQGARVVECFALLTRAHVGRVTGAPHKAVEDDLDATVALIEETSALTYEPFVAEELGRLRNDRAELRKALQLYERIGATGHARRLEAELSARTSR